MGFSLEHFIGELLSMLEQAKKEEKSIDEIIEYAKEQAQYAKECGVKY